MTQDQPLPPAEIINRLRQRVEAGDVPSREEVRRGLDAYRREREAAPSSTKKKAAAGPTRSAAELLQLLSQPISQPDNGDSNAST